MSSWDLVIHYTLVLDLLLLGIIADGVVLESSGKGDVMLPMRALDGTIHQLVFYDVYLVRHQPYSLISISSAVRDGWESPNFKSLYWTIGGVHFPLTATAGYSMMGEPELNPEYDAGHDLGFRMLAPAQAPVASSGESGSSASSDSEGGRERTKEPPASGRKRTRKRPRSASAKAKKMARRDAANREAQHRRERGDWQLKRSLVRDLFEQYGKTGVDTGFEVDLYTDGLLDDAEPTVSSQSNSQLPRFFSARNSAHSPTNFWRGNACWGNPVFDPDFIRQMFMKAEEEFNADPANTRFMFCVPYIPNSPWWHFTSSYKVIQEIEADDKVFSLPNRSAYNVGNLEPAGDEGGAERSFIGATGFKCVILYRDINTAQTCTPELMLHLRMGHFSNDYVYRLKELGCDLGIQVSNSRLKQSFCPCIPCKIACLLYTSPSPRDLSTSRMPSSA